MRSVMFDQFCVQLIQEKRPNDVPLYRIEIEGGEALYSHVSIDAARHYLEMLIAPMLRKTPVSRY